MGYHVEHNTLFLFFTIVILWISIDSVKIDKTVAKIAGNISIGALFPMHHKPSSAGGFTRQCGRIWEQYGIHRIEIFLKTLDEINASPDILPNVTLGCDIRDSCWYPPVALEQSIDFIKNSIASLEKKSHNRTDDPCDADNEDPIAGLIGPGSSTVTIQIQNLLSLFHIPQIGYSATSKDLSDKSLYKYFLRVVPSDKLQAKALLDIVQYYNWTYVSTVYTEGNYGSSGMEEFQEMLSGANLCEATAEKVLNGENETAHDVVIEKLMQVENARVVVCFCEGLTIRRLLEAAERKKVSGRFLFLGSDGWNVRPDVVKDIEPLAAGGLSMKLYSPDIDSFNHYFLQLKPHSNTRNPWFKEFWEEKFNCSLSGRTSKAFPKSCTGNEDLSKDFTPDAKLGFVVNAIYTMAHALDHMQRDVCGDTAGLCKEMKPVNGSLFLEYLYNVSFLSYSNDSIHFDSTGDPPGRYDVMNYRPRRHSNGTTVYGYERIGGWDNGVLALQDDVFWPQSDEFVKSVCSDPCPAGERKLINDGHVRCCWTCTACQDDEFLFNESHCEKCEKGSRPNEELTGCLAIPVEYMQWGDTEAIISMVFSCVGVIATGWTAVVFIRHNDTPVVKASTRELSYIILIGIAVSFLTSFPLVAKPTLVTCYLVRILPGFSFSLIYGALVTKTNRIARILAGSKKKIMTRKPRFMSASAQLVITFIIIGIECAIITVMLIFEPADSKMLYLPKHRVRLICNATTKGIIVPLGFIGFLIAMCTLYAIKTRNLPENFNEAKFIGFTMYTTCIIWLAFVGIYFGSDNKIITMCMAITLSATVALVLLFFPKIYIIVCKPEKNNRSAFTTSKDVRCHIGSTTRCAYSHASMDRFESPSPSVYQWKVNHMAAGPKLVACDKQIDIVWNDKTFENAALTIYRQRNVFDRWRRKSSGKTDTKDTSGSPAYSQVATSATAVTHGNDSDFELVDEKMTPHKSPKGKVIRRIKAPAPFKDFEMEFEEMDAVMEDNNSQTSDHNDVTTVDSGVQTGNELLHELITGLRKRKTSLPADKSESGHYEKNSGHSRSTSTSTPSGSIPSDQGVSIRNNHYRTNARNQMYDCSEPKQTYTQKYVLSPQHNDNSPLLSPNREGFDYESTSEETLSEPTDPLHDLDTLLMGVEPYVGSLNSLKGSTDNTRSDSNTSKTSESTVKPPSKPRSKCTNHSLSNSKDNKNTNMPTHSKKKIENGSAASSAKHNKTQRLPVNDSSAYRNYSPLPTSPTATPTAAIPRIRVEQASRSSSELSADSGRPSDCAFDSRRTSLLSGRAERTSADLSSIEDLSLCISDLSGADAPVFNSPDSKHKPKDTDSVTEFREYLRTKGLKLDLNSVQSSEV